METVQLPCKHCGQLMGVSVEHMGSQVHCPHCDGIVDVPAADVMSDRTLIEQKDDPLGREMPKSSKHNGAIERTGITREPAFQPPWIAAPDRQESLEDDSLPEPPRIERPRESNLAIILLLFLIPYAIATTGYIAWLLYQSSQARNFDPLERLPDKANDGGARQVQHDLDIPGKLRTPMKQALTVGDLEVTPMKVDRLTRGKFVYLELVLKAKNVGTGVEFNPINQDFCHFKPGSGAARPYTFLQTGKNGERLYGGQLDLALLDQGKEKLVNDAQRLRPGQEMLIHLTTRSDDSGRVKAILDHPQDLLWRVQVRRGLVSTRHGPRSATAVIGVQFNSSAIEG